MGWIVSDSEKIRMIWFVQITTENETIHSKLNEVNAIIASRNGKPFPNDTTSHSTYSVSGACDVTMFIVAKQGYYILFFCQFGIVYNSFFLQLVYL